MEAGVRVLLLLLGVMPVRNSCSQLRSSRKLFWLPSSRVRRGLIQALREPEAGDLNEFEASLTYKMSSRTARGWRTSVLQKGWSRNEAAKMITDFTSLS